MVFTIKDWGEKKEKTIFLKIPSGHLSAMFSRFIYWFLRFVLSSVIREAARVQG